MPFSCIEGLGQLFLVYLHGFKARPSNWSLAIFSQPDCSQKIVVRRSLRCPLLSLIIGSHPSDLTSPLSLFLINISLSWFQPSISNFIQKSHISFSFGSLYLKKTVKRPNILFHLLLTCLPSVFLWKQNQQNDSVWMFPLNLDYVVHSLLYRWTRNRNNLESVKIVSKSTFIFSH